MRTTFVPFISALIAAFAVMVLFAVAMDNTKDEPKPQAPATVIEEDDPRWDCATMGNKVCGPK